MGVLLSGAVALTWNFALEPEVTATPSILLNGIQHSLEELSMMAEVSVVDNATSTTVMLMAVGVEWNVSRWRWMLEEFGGALQSDETVLVVRGMGSNAVTKVMAKLHVLHIVMYMDECIAEIWHVFLSVSILISEFLYVLLLLFHFSALQALP